MPALNKIKLVEKMHNEYLRGMPDGLDEEYFRKIHILFDRINELQNALDPFAHIGHRIHTKKETAEMVNVYAKDCVNAIAMMDPANSEEDVKKIYYPSY